MTDQEMIKQYEELVFKGEQQDDRWLGVFRLHLARLCELARAGMAARAGAALDAGDFS